MKRKLLKNGVVSLVIGLFLTIGSFSSRALVGAQSESSQNTTSIATVALVIGIALIVLSAILFIMASAASSED